MTSVSFIIPSYNSYLTVEKTMASIFGQRLKDMIAEVIVVDSSDDDKTRKIFKRFDHPKLKVITLDRKMPPSAGRNIGADAATGSCLCFVDSDVFLSEDWLTHILEAVNNGCRAGCGSVSVPEDQQKNALALAQLYLQFNESLAVGKTRQVSLVPACNMFVDRALFLKVGGFPNLRASEDVVLCLNIGRTDPVWFVPAAKCFHIFREERQSYFNNQIILGKYIIVYRRMMYHKWYYNGLWPVLLLPGFLLIKFLRILSRIARAGGGHFKNYLMSFPLFLAGLYYWAVGFVQGCVQKE